MFTSTDFCRTMLCFFFVFFTGQASSAKCAQASVQGNVSLFPLNHTAGIGQYLFLRAHLRNLVSVLMVFIESN